MLKKPLIAVSIIAVVILVLCSFTNVVGYQTVKSTTVNESPLFAVRTMRAINEESKDVLTFGYLGNNKPITIPFPISRRNNQTTLLLNNIEKISKMNEKQFEQFIFKSIYYLKTIGKITQENDQDVMTGLRLLRTNPKEIMSYILHNDSSYYTEQNYCTVIKQDPFHGCRLLLIVNLLGLILYLIIVGILEIYWKTHPTSALCCGMGTVN